jgi:hypothetical protein
LNVFCAGWQRHSRKKKKTHFYQTRKQKQKELFKMIVKVRWNLNILQTVKRDVKELAAQTEKTESEIVQLAIIEYLIKKEAENRG